jgi:hypothetical protein
MSHLMQPLEIEGTKHCLSDNGRRTTVGVATEILTSASSLVDVSVDPWQLVELPTGDLAADTEISFGVSCATEILLYFEVSDNGGDGYVVVQPYVNGVAYGLPLDMDEGDSPVEDWPIDISDIPCGNIITIVCSASRTDDDEPLTVLMRIDGIS